MGKFNNAPKKVNFFDHNKVAKSLKKLLLLSFVKCKIESILWLAEPLVTKARMELVFSRISDMRNSTDFDDRRYNLTTIHKWQRTRSSRESSINKKDKKGTVSEQM